MARTSLRGFGVGFLGAAWTAALVAGCLLPSVDRLSGGRADASVVDATDDLSEGAAEAGCVNVLLNPGFEDKATCDPWISYGGPASTTDAAYSGAAACRVCGITLVNVLTPLLGTNVPPGARVTFTGRLRAADGKLLASQMNVSINALKKQVLLSSTYDPFSIELIFPEGGTDPQLRLNGDSHDGGCILMDELTACIVPP